MRRGGGGVNTLQCFCPCVCITITSYSNTLWRATDIRWLVSLCCVMDNKCNWNIIDTVCTIFRIWIIIWGRLCTCLSVCGGAEVCCPAAVKYILSATGRSNPWIHCRHISAKAGTNPPALLKTTVPEYDHIRNMKMNGILWQENNLPLLFVIAIWISSNLSFASANVFPRGCTKNVNLKILVILIKSNLWDGSHIPSTFTFRKCSSSCL